MKDTWPVLGDHNRRRNSCTEAAVQAVQLYRLYSCTVCTLGFFSCTGGKGSGHLIAFVHQTLGFCNSAGPRTRFAQGKILALKLWPLTVASLTKN